MFNGSEKVKLQYQMPLCLWFSAARLETVTAGQADNHYRLRPADRGNLVFQVKALPNRYKCKLYRLVDILRVARAQHLGHGIGILPKKNLVVLCKFLGLKHDGTYKQVCRRITTTLVAACQA